MTDSGLKIAYLSGRITGDPMYAYRFADAEMVLSHLGYVVLNPCILPAGMNYEDYMWIDFAMIDKCDVLVLLPTWRRSEGAKRERKYAEELGKRVMRYEDVLLTEGIYECKAMA